MPNRYLRASYIDSERINALSPNAERMFCRLLVHVDDFGRCEANTSLLRGKLFALQIDKVKPADIQSWVEELAAQDLLFLYTDNGRVYIQMQRFEKGRAHKSKCPDPPTSANICLHLYADANKCPDTDSDTDSDTDKRSKASSGFDRFWDAYPRKTGKLAARKAFDRAKSKPPVDELIRIVKAHTASDQWTKDDGKYIPNPATWLNQGRWDDQLQIKASRPEPPVIIINQQNKGDA